MVKKFFSRSLSLVVGLAIVLSAVGIATAKDGKITKKGFKYGNMNYWRVGAQNVKLGSCGTKRTSYGMEVDHHMKASSLKKKTNTSKVYEINWGRDSSFTAGASLQYVGVKGGASYSRSVSKSANLKLVLIDVPKGDLKKIINSKETRCLKYLRDKKSGSGRVVSAVWVVMEATLANSVTNGGSVEVSGVTPNAMTLSGSFKGSSTQTSSVTIPSGAIFAYMLHKPSKWNKKKLKKTTIKDMKDDQVGMR
jgi:hypothetical protein